MLEWINVTTKTIISKRVATATVKSLSVAITKVECDRGRKEERKVDKEGKTENWKT
jgi:hypothetical protein